MFRGIITKSAKEGWGLIVTEANSQGTPAVVYDVDGLRDSVKHLKSGIISKDGDPAALGTALCDLLDDPKLYEELRENAWEWSKEFTFENSYREFCKKTNIS
jgi:glycosyltransferase involved in cell wall biosynthesis